MDKFIKQWRKPDMTQKSLQNQPENITDDGKSNLNVNNVAEPVASSSSLSSECNKKTDTENRDVVISSDSDLEENDKRNRTTKQSAKVVIKKRNFRREWLSEWKWMEYDSTTDKVFCLTCKDAYLKHKIKKLDASICDKLSYSSFVENGFDNYVNGVKRFKNHEKSNLHKNACTKMLLVNKGTDVSQQLSKSKEREMKDARTALVKVIETFLHKAIEGEALRGHTDESSKLFRLLKLRCHDIPELNSWMNRTKCKWLSHDIIDEYLALLANSVRNKIINIIKNATYFSIMADETTDLSHKEQFSFNFRYVDDMLEIHEVFFGFYETPFTDALTLYNVVTDIFTRFQFSFENLRGQCYDRASNVSGHISGLQRRIGDIQPKALFVHCAAHNLNLVAQDAMTAIPKFRDFLNVMKDLVNFIRLSPKRLKSFEIIQNQADNDYDRVCLKQFCPTRWCLRVSSLDTIYKNYEELITFLEEISKEKTDGGSKARGFLKSIKSFDTFFFC